MSRKTYTFMIIPHAEAKFRRVRVSRNLLLVAGGLLGVLVIGGLMLPHFLLKSSRLGASLSEAVEENAGLREANERFENSLSELRATMNEVEGKARKFALMVGVEDVGPEQMAAGGGSLSIAGLGQDASQAVLEGEIETLRERSGALQDSFTVLDTAFQKQALLLASTPSILPVRGLLGNGYGWRIDPFTGMRDFHSGLDIIGPKGTKVVAPADGIVTQVGQKGGFGLSIVLSHGYGIVTKYAHLDRAEVRVGQRVKRGEVIARVGSSGRSTGPHLHYEVVAHRKRVDPIKYILEEYRTF